jgi:GNAT superfamily N-acetyltransferase
MDIDYKVNAAISVEQFIDILQRSTLGERRPLHDRSCMEGMVRHADLTVTAWERDKLIGVARSITDFHYACWLSELAVDRGYQRHGIGKALIMHTRSALGPHCKIRLIAAPAAADYYPHIGFEPNPHCWEILPGRMID